MPERRSSSSSSPPRSLPGEARRGGGGAGIGIWIADGYWPLAGGIGVLLLAFHGIVLAVGQRFDSTRLARSDLVKVAAFGLGATIVVALLNVIF